MRKIQTLSQELNSNMVARIKKDFSLLVDDYSFFKSNSNEYEVNSNKLINKLTSSKQMKKGIKILDFGGGDGQLLFDIYSKTQLAELNPILHILEPVDEYVKIAKERIRSFGHQNLIQIDRLDKCSDNYFDLILINHVLYYVDDLEFTILEIMKKLNSNGEAWIILGNANNALIILWKKMFKKLGIPIPYFLIEDLKSSIEIYKIKFEESNEMHSKFIFLNSSENRKKMIRFLVGNHEKQINDENFIKEIKSYIKNNKIELPLSDNLLILKK